MSETKEHFGHHNVVSETAGENGSVVITLNPHTAQDRFMWGLRTLVEKPEIGAYIRKMEIINPTGPETNGKKYKSEMIFRILVSTEELRSNEEIRDEAEKARFTNFLTQYLTDAVVAMERPAHEIAEYLDRVQQTAEELGIPTACRPLKSLLTEIGAAIKFREMQKP